MAQELERQRLRRVMERFIQEWMATVDWEAIQRVILREILRGLPRTTRLYRTDLDVIDVEVVTIPLKNDLISPPGSSI